MLDLRKLALLTIVLFASKAFSIIDLSEDPLTKEKLLETINQSRATDLDDVPALLPDDVSVNFVLKHGIQIKGPRGHEVEKDVSQSSDPELPRAILFDERTGTAVSYNGGEKNKKGETQTHSERLDVLTFDHQNKTFHLDAITFQNQNPGQVVFDDTSVIPAKDKCTSCHGPLQRPIFSMYPDWPTFYGSDNDELLDRGKRQQVDENRNYVDFLANAGKTNPRYSALYSEERVQKYFNRSLQWYTSFPYRPNLSGNLEDPSRAFAYRPGLRMGILYNRLTAIQVAELIKNHKNYEDYGTYFLFNLLQCGWQSTAKQRSWLQNIEQVLGARPMTRQGGLLDYRQNLSLFGLRVNDVDIRFSYNHPSYQRNSNNDTAEDVMDVGYIGNRYFNSYFDGSATIDELLAYQLYEDMRQRQGLRVSLTPRSLVGKYGHRSRRMVLDRLNFEQMDEFSQWIPIAYPRSLSEAHHREGYPQQFQQQHTRLCRALEERL